MFVVVAIDPARIMILIFNKGHRQSLPTGYRQGQLVRELRILVAEGMYCSSTGCSLWLHDVFCGFRILFGGSKIFFLVAPGFIFVAPGCSLQLQDVLCGSQLM